MKHIVSHQNTITLDTNRLLLRQWREEDLETFALINSDPRVMAYYVETLDKTASDAFAHKIAQLIEQRGWGFWAVELKSNHEFIGFVGLHDANVQLPFAPCIEIGWRLGVDHWGKGYATEAAKEALRFGFEKLNLSEIVSFTSLSNFRSEAVMKRLGMQKDPDTFQHPSVPEGHRLRTHVLYRLLRDQWRQFAILNNK